MIRLSNFFELLGRNSSVVGLFIDFLTSGLSFVKNCWRLILWCLGGRLFFVFICWAFWGIFDYFYFRPNDYGPFLL